MASLTIAQRLDRVKAYCNQYIPLQKLPDQLLIKFIERSRDHVWRGIISERDFLFRKFATVADGDNYPTGYVSYANNAYYTTGGNDIPFTFINIQEIGAASNNRYALGTATTPKVFFSDGKIHTITSLSGIQFEYIAQPAALDGQPLTTTDEMPEDTEDMITRGAFERLLGQLRNDRDMLALAELQKDDVQRASQQYYIDYYQKNILAGGGIELTD